MSYVLILVLGVAAESATPPPPLNVEAIAAGIARRQDHYRNLRVKAVLTTTVPKVVDEKPAKKWVPGVPITTQVDWRVQADFGRDFLQFPEYYESKPELVEVPKAGEDDLLQPPVTNHPLARSTICAFDGTVYRRLLPPDSERRQSQGEELSYKDTWFMENLLWYFFLPFNVSSALQVTEPDAALKAGDFVFEKQANLEGKPNYVLKGSFYAPDFRKRPDAGWTRIWVSADGEFNISRWEQLSSKDELFISFEVSEFGQKEGISYPKRFRMRKAAISPLPEKERLVQARMLGQPADNPPHDTLNEYHVTEIAFSPELVPGDFQFKYPPGAIVVDRINDRTFRVPHDIRPPSVHRKLELDERLNEARNERKKQLPQEKQEGK